jgi:hypothetical protein
MSRKCVAAGGVAVSSLLKLRGLNHQRELRKDRLADPAEILKDCKKPRIEGLVLYVGCVDKITIPQYSVGSIHVELFIMSSACGLVGISQAAWQ